MTKRKFTDEEVIKALECLAGADGSCVGCIYQSTPFPACRELVARQALGIINRHRAEIEGLKGVIAAYEDAARESHEEHVKQQAIIDEILTILRGGQPNDPPSMPAGLSSEIV